MCTTITYNRHPTQNVTHPEVVEEGAILKELHDDHDWLYLSDHTIQLDNVRVVELTHDGRLREKVIPLLG